MSSLTSKAIAYFKPCVRDGDNTSAVKLSREEAPVMTAVGNGLVVAYLVDDGDSFVYIQFRDLDNDEVTEHELHHIGIRNLLRMTTAGALRIKPCGNAFMATLDGNFEASLLLPNLLWRNHFRQFVSGDYLVAIPNRDILVFCARSSTDGRTDLLKAVEAQRDSDDHPLSCELFVRRDSEWLVEGDA
ncbi:DUF1444 family protein [Rhodopirellula sp. SWK7]|uniref:DUF1444 family protein n=1 Tax=Rhodopirellula sp. SWK7 TaxID=595460 RepID=UPI0002BDA3E9|nr:DUF1444 family protein [Rhodopirellula sp. SWK7]EMI41951.1 hypothetical protein RRSWK_05547 [Rhodopirellula sp. SWK7]